MSDENQASHPQHPHEDERNNPVFRFGQAVAIFMVVVWAAVLILVFYLVFRFWLS